MFRKASILFSFILIFTAFAQERETNYSLIYPEFIPYNSSFDISLTVTNSYPNADEFELIIIPGSRLTLNRAEYKSVYESLKLSPSIVTSEEFFKDVYSIKIKLDDSLRSEGIVFQILLNMKTEQSNSTQIKFKGIFKAENSEIAYLSTQSFEADKENIISADVEFYKPQKISDKALSLEENALFQMDIGKNFNHDFLLDFWIKFSKRSQHEPGSEEDIQFLKIFRNDFTRADFILLKNKFQMLAVSSSQNNELYLKPYFIGDKSWYHITVATSKDEGTINFYCNGLLLAKNQLLSIFEEKDLRLVFGNPSKDKSYMIDLLRIIDLNNTENLSFNNRHSLHFTSDSSALIAMYKFDSSNEFLTENKNVKVDFSNIKFVKSDAPLFARSPELNITFLGNSYELEWKGGDFKQAQYYMLEKSSGNNPYVQIHNVQADNTHEKHYSFLDVPDKNSEVVYYRIKQQNYDGSVVYSSQVKVGQGTIEPFTIGQNFPNPFNPKTSIEIEMIEDSEIEITIYSLDGTEIAKLYKGFLSKGLHKFNFDGEGLPSGIYLYKVEAPNFNQTKKMILTK